MQIRVLIVEDESLIRWSLRQKFEERGYRVTEAENGKSAIEAIEGARFDLIMLDFKLPDMTGVDILRSIREMDNDAVVLMMTAYSTIETAVEAIKLGAFDYIPKPFQMEHLLHTVDKALETTKLRREVRELRHDLQERYGSATLIGDSEPMRRLLETIQQVARTGASTILLRGETGTGKDLVARIIHQHSDRATQQFVNITCTAISDTLLESELFGHERGAFTDAKLQKKGLLELADGGTAFLDEIGDMQPALQAKLLRFLEERRFRRVGGTKEIDTDVRVIAATNRDIEKAIIESKFRQDLFYRLNVVSILIPPLRGRGDDVKLLTSHFVEKFSREFKKPIARVADDAYARMAAYGWPGNVRELKNVVERAVLLCKSDSITADDIAVGTLEPPPTLWDFEHMPLPEGGFDLDKLQILESRLIKQAMDRAQGNQSKAAKLLNVSRDRLRYGLQKHGML